MSSRTTSAASVENLVEERRAREALWLRTYLNSEGGKDGARGTAMALLAKMVRRVTKTNLQHCAYIMLELIERSPAYLRSRSCFQ